MVREKVVWLHVGHGKTGSSALQSSFARSKDSLSENGVYYPEDASLGHAARGGITSGNAWNLLTEDNTAFHQKLSHDLASAGYLKCDQILYSSELMFGQIFKDPRLLDIALKEMDTSGTTPRVVLYIRDPLDFAVSGYIQRVKRAGEVRSLGEYLREFTPLENFLTFVSLIEERGVEWSVQNFSAVRFDLLPSMEGVMGIPSGTLSPGNGAPVNRSLTRSELEIQLLFNSLSEISTSTFVSDPWCDALPEIDGEIPHCDQHDLSDFLTRCEGLLDQANRLLPEHAKFQLGGTRGVGLGDIPPTELETFTFNRQQLVVLVTALSSHLKET